MQGNNNIKSSLYSTGRFGSVVWALSGHYKVAGLVPVRAYTWIEGFIPGGKCFALKLKFSPSPFLSL